MLNLRGAKIVHLNSQCLLKTLDAQSSRSEDCASQFSVSFDSSWRGAIPYPSQEVSSKGPTPGAGTRMEGPIILATLLPPDPLSKAVAVAATPIASIVGIAVIGAGTSISTVSVIS
eukprot:gene21408-biopygen7344